jgi:molybdopterin-guanine dinucleotide biosynthesis protein A
MSLLGAILAGGKSSRFGSDKAVAIVDGLPLIDHVVMGMFRNTDHLLIVGRNWRDFDTVPDGAHAGEGPLAGLLAALTYAAAHGHDGVLTAACDALPVPDLAALAEQDGPAVIEGHWLFGYWPTDLAGELAAWLDGQPDRSVRGWLVRCNAGEVAAPEPIQNLNTREDLAAYEAALRTGA